MGSKGSSQQAPDYTGAAIAEGAQLRDSIDRQTAANRSDQSNPWGDSKWTSSVDADGHTRWSQDNTLAGGAEGDLQNALNSQFSQMADRSKVSENMADAFMNDPEAYAAMDWDQYNTAATYDPTTGQRTGGTEAGIYHQNGPVDTSGLPARAYDIRGETANALQNQGALDFSGAPTVQDQQLSSDISWDRINDIGPQQLSSDISWNGIENVANQSMMQGTGFEDPGLSGQNLQTDLDYSGASGVGESGDIRNKAEDALYDRGAQRLDRRMGQATNDMEIKLRGQGLQPGDESYDRAMTDLNNQKTDAYQALSNEAIMGGGQEASRDFNMQMDRRGMMTGEQDRQGQYRNEALSGQFGIDAQRQAQQQQLAQNEAGFSNQAGQSQYQMDQDRRQNMFNENKARGQFQDDNKQRQFDMDSQRRAQMFGENEARGNFQDSAKERQFAMDTARRNQATGESEKQGQYANAATGQQYQMNQDAAQNRTDNEFRRIEQINQQRDQAYNEMLSTGTENRSRNREYVDSFNQNRQNQINENMMGRAQRTNEMNAWNSGQQVSQPQFQSYNQAGNAGAPQLLQAAGMQGQQQAANQSAQNAGWGGMMSGLGSIAGAIPWSDRRLKKNIKRIGTKKGYPWYSFDYIWGESSEGVMADEIPEEFRVKDGEFNRVNYGALFA